MAKNSKKTKKYQVAVKDTQVQDAFVNPVAKLGLGLNNLISGTDYYRSRFTQDYNLLVTLYRSHWIIKKIVDVVANDMTKAGINIKSDNTELKKAIDGALRSKRISSRLNEGVRWARLFGGAGALMMIKGQDNILDKPLELNSIMQDDFKGLLVFDRWSGITPTGELVDDIDSIDFGLPKYYRITTSDAEAFTVHHSRILRFPGRKLPRWEEEVEQMWGASEVEAIFEELAKRDNTSYNIAQLVFLANLRVLKMNDLGDGLTLNDQQAQEDLYNTLTAQNTLLSNFGMYVMNKDDEFDTKQYTFAGLSDIMQQFMLDLSGATGIPATKLYGRSPSGLNATGESDLQNYYEMIKENQEITLRDVYTKLLPVISMSEFGIVDEYLDFDFETIETVKDEEVADIINRKSDNIIKSYDANIITQSEARKELKEIGKDYEVFQNLDESVEASEKLNNGVPDFSGFGNEMNFGSNEEKLPEPNNV